MMEKTKTMEKIQVRYGVVRKLAEQFQVSTAKVYNALNYLYPLNEDHIRIRKEAVEHFGGVHIEMPVLERMNKSVTQLV
jgi:hypothetical protein